MEVDASPCASRRGGPPCTARLVALHFRCIVRSGRRPSPRGCHHGSDHALLVSPVAGVRPISVQVTYTPGASSSPLGALMRRSNVTVALPCVSCTTVPEPHDRPSGRRAARVAMLNPPRPAPKPITVDKCSPCRPCVANTLHPLHVWRRHRRRAALLDLTVSSETWPPTCASATGYLSTLLLSANHCMRRIIPIFMNVRLVRCLPPGERGGVRYGMRLVPADILAPHVLLPLELTCLVHAEDARSFARPC